MNLGKTYAKSGPGSVRAFSILRQLRSRILGPWLPDMPYTHSHGAAPVLLNVH